MEFLEVLRLIKQNKLEHWDIIDKWYNDNSSSLSQNEFETFYTTIADTLHFPNFYRAWC